MRIWGWKFSRADFWYITWPLLLFLLVTYLEPFNIPNKSRELSRQTIARFAAPFYPPLAEEGPIVILIDDASLLEAGLRWPIPTQNLNALLRQVHQLNPAVVFLDVMLTDLREYRPPSDDKSHADGDPSPPVDAKRLPSFCSPCRGGDLNPIRSLSCFYRPALRLEPEPARGALDSCKDAAASESEKTPFIAAGANPSIAPNSVQAQRLSRCLFPTDDEIQESRQLAGSKSWNTVASCLQSSASVAPIQWRDIPGQYPLYTVTVPGMPAEPSVALVMFQAYCNSAAPIDSEKVCSRLFDAGYHKPGLENLLVKWRLMAPKENVEREIPGCEPGRGLRIQGGPGSETFWKMAWTSIDLFYNGLLSNISGAAHEAAQTTCPPFETIIPDMRETRFIDGFKDSNPFAGRPVLIGTNVGTAPDLQSSPVHESIPGVFLHAMALDNLMHFGPEYDRAAVPGGSEGRRPNHLMNFLPAIVSFIFGAIIVLKRKMNQEQKDNVTKFIPNKIFPQNSNNEDGITEDSSQYERNKTRGGSVDEIVSIIFFFLSIAVIATFAIIAWLVDEWTDAGTGTSIDWIMLALLAVAAFADAVPAMAFLFWRWLKGPQWITGKILIATAPALLLLTPVLRSEPAYYVLVASLSLVALTALGMFHAVWIRIHNQL